MSEPTYQEICAAFKLSLRDIAKLRTERDAAVLKFQHNQRLCDLVRHQRMELHEAGLISDEEYSELAKDHPAVERLEQYDAAFIGRHALKLELETAQGQYRSLKVAFDMLYEGTEREHKQHDRLLILCGKMREALGKDCTTWELLQQANEVLGEVKT